MLVAANGADIASSVGSTRYESNPLLRGANGGFGPRGTLLKCGLVGGGLLFQHLVLRKRPDLDRRAAWLNLMMAGALGSVAVQNLRR